MVKRMLTVIAVLAVASAAHADSPKLAEARKAIEEVRFDDAQRLLVGALADGGNSPAGVREIYKLSASTAVVLGQREVGEQNYRRWLVLDAAASIGADVAPKLREPFEAAQAYVAAHGRLAAMATRVSAAEITVAVSDPLAMAVSATISGGTPVPLSTERRARLTPPDPGPAVVAILDDRGNRLVEITAPAVAASVPVAEPAVVGPAPTRSQRSYTWVAFAVPSVLLLATGVGFGLAAINDGYVVEKKIEGSELHFYTDVEDRNARRKTLTWVAGATLGAGAILVVPTVVLLLRSRKERAVVPFVGHDSAGAALVGRF